MINHTLPEASFATVTQTLALYPTYTSSIAAFSFAIGGQTEIGASPVYGTDRAAATSSDAAGRSAAARPYYTYMVLPQNEKLFQGGTSIRPNKREELLLDPTSTGWIGWMDGQNGWRDGQIDQRSLTFENAGITLEPVVGFCFLVALELQLGELDLTTTITEVCTAPDQLGGWHEPQNLYIRHRALDPLTFMLPC